jgi:uncharacterized membrane protein YeaQ/YmgE (transglycosylase-associated protein family)
MFKQDKLRMGDIQKQRKNNMHIIGTIIIGFLAGLVAKMLMPGKDPSGFIVTTLLGIGGAFLAKYLGSALNLYRADEPAGFIAAVIGAIIILAVYHLFMRSRNGVATRRTTL